MEADHQNQLEGISLELMHFESSLRTKESQIDTMLGTKDQVRDFTISDKNDLWFYFNANAKYVKEVGQLRGKFFLLEREQI